MVRPTCERCTCSGTSPRRVEDTVRWFGSAERPAATGCRMHPQVLDVRSGPESGTHSRLLGRRRTRDRPVRTAALDRSLVASVRSITLNPTRLRWNSRNSVSNCDRIRADRWPARVEDPTRRSDRNSAARLPSRPLDHAAAQQVSHGS